MTRLDFAEPARETAVVDRDWKSGEIRGTVYEPLNILTSGAECQELIWLDEGTRRPFPSETKEVPDQSEAGFLAFFRVELAGKQVSALDGTGKTLAAVGRFRDDATGVERLGEIRMDVVEIRIRAEPLPDVGVAASGGGGEEMLFGSPQGKIPCDWSPDGRRFATAALDGLLRVWGLVNP